MYKNKYMSGKQYFHHLFYEDADDADILAMNLIQTFGCLIADFINSNRKVPMGKVRKGIILSFKHSVWEVLIEFEGRKRTR